MSVLVAQLERDEDRSQTTLILRSLEHVLDLGGSGRQVELLDAGRVLRRGASSNVNQQREDAETRGREWLEEAGADVLIWGEVAEKGEALRIFFLPSEGRHTRQLSESYGVTGKGVAYLSTDFNEDLGDVIAAQAVATSSPTFEAGNFAADLLDEISARLEALAATKAISESPEQRPITLESSPTCDQVVGAWVITRPRRKSSRAYRVQRLAQRSRRNGPDCRRA